MPKLVPITPKKLAKILERIGFTKRDAEGSHIFFRHDDGRTTVIAMHRKELGRGILRKILNDVQLTVEEYDRLRQ